MKYVRFREALWKPLSRACWLNESRKMRFEEAFKDWQPEAARLLREYEYILKWQNSQYEV
jgi:hypothetical protein